MPKPNSAVDPLGVLGASKYKKISDLSSGSFGFVQLAECKKTKEQVAIKFLKRDHITRYVESELLNHRNLRHPHVIEFKEVFLTPEHICIVMEYAKGGSLFSYVQQRQHLNEAGARWYFQQLIVGMEFCHRKGIANRDIKLENTLLQVHPGLPLPLLKICDFGYSKADNMSAPKSCVGTLTYMAPEIISASSRRYDGKKADIWSCGIMLYVMLFGRYPFEPTDKKLSHGARVRWMLDRINSMQLDIPANIPVSSDCLDLLSKLLVPDPRHRLTIQQIYQHPWFLQYLPPNAIEMNDQFMVTPVPQGYQSADDIKKILEEAQQPTTPSLYRSPFDDLLDAEVEVMLP